MRRPLSRPGVRRIGEVLAIAFSCVAVVQEPGTAFTTDAAGAEATAGVESVERGKTIYDRRCAVCHGPQGRGDGPEAPFLSPRPSSLLSAATSVKSDAELLQIIEKGKPRTAMPAWKESLSDAERREVLSYIRSLIRFQKSVIPAPPAPDVNR